MTSRSYSQADAYFLPVATEKVHLVVTSPPYYNAKIEYSQWDSYDDYLDFMKVAIHQMYFVLVDGGRIAINVPQGYDRPGNGGYKTLESDILRMMLMQGFEIRGHIVWHKLGMSPQGRGTAWGSWKSPSNPSLRDIHEVIIVGHKGSAKMPVTGEATISRQDFLDSTKSVWDILPKSSSWHPAPFPDEIPRRLIELYSYTNAVVLDPFCGSGTTPRVAASLGRIGIGFDFSMKYLRRADEDRIDLERWERGKGIRLAGESDEGLPLFDNAEKVPHV